MTRKTLLLVALAPTAFVGALLVALTAHGDTRADAAAILDAVASDAKHKDATAAVVQRGRDALERATRMRAAGDEAHAQLADGLALEEAETARDLVRAIDMETQADDARRGATDAGVVGERERALLEEGIGRNGRMKAELAEVERARSANKPGKPASKAPVGDAGAK